MDEVGLGTQSHLPALYPDSFFTPITVVFRGTFSDGPHPDLWAWRPEQPTKGGVRVTLRPHHQLGIVASGWGVTG